MVTTKGERLFASALPRAPGGDAVWRREEQGHAVHVQTPSAASALRVSPSGSLWTTDVAYERWEQPLGSWVLRRPAAYCKRLTKVRSARTQPVLQEVSGQISLEGAGRARVCQRVLWGRWVRTAPWLGGDGSW